MAVMLLSPLLIYAIFRVAAPGIAPAAAMQFDSLPPADHSLMLKQLARVAKHPQQKLPHEALKLAKAGAPSVPLRFEPFFVSARAEAQAGRLDRAIALMEEARRRHPRYTPTRTYLIDHYARTGRYPQAVNEMEFVLQRDPGVRGVLLPAMAQWLSIPEGRSAVASLLASEPEWREEFVRAAANQKVRPEDALALLRQVRARKKTGDTAAEQRLYINALVSAGNYGQARSAWLTLVPAGARPENGSVFDGAFAGVDAPEPFGWKFADADAGRSEIEGSKEGRSYLDVHYFGGRTIELAHQLLALSPGKHRMIVTAESETGITSGQLHWRLTCLPEGTQIGKLTIEKAAASPSKLEKDFVVPSASCPGQRLSLVAEPGDVAADVNVRFAALQIR